jgi:DNA-binding NtrC family response regulator
MIDQQMTFTEVVECLETNLLRQALAEAGGNRTAAARHLGLSQSTLRDKLKRHGLDDSDG